MAGEKVQQFTNTPFCMPDASWLPKKQEEKIVIPFRAPDNKAAAANEGFENYYGLEVEKGLVKKVEYTTGKYAKPQVTLNDGAEITPLIGGSDDIKFDGNHPKVYKDKSGYTVFENFKNSDISNYEDTNDKYSLKNTKGVLLYSGGGNDSVKVENVKYSAISFSEKSGKQSIIDGAANPKKAPGVSGVIIKREANNQVFWNERTQYFDEK